LPALPPAPPAPPDPPMADPPLAEPPWAPFSTILLLIMSKSPRLAKSTDALPPVALSASPLPPWAPLPPWPPTPPVLASTLTAAPVPCAERPALTVTPPKAKPPIPPAPPDPPAPPVALPALPAPPIARLRLILVSISLAYPAARSEDALPPRPVPLLARPPWPPAAPLPPEMPPTFPLTLTPTPAP
jgi:hypothetical protein